VMCCTAEVLTSISLHDGEAAGMDHVIMDEFHYFGDSSRGAAWEIPLWRLSGAAFLLMSGTLGANPALYAAIQEHTGRRLSVVSSDRRPVPLDFSYSRTSVKATIESLAQEERYPVYAVHFSQRESLLSARSFLDNPPFEMSLEKHSALQQALSDIDFKSPFGPELRRLLEAGIGIHHAGLLPRYRRLVEQLAQKSLLWLVCGTDTLGVGVNVPIRSVLFTRLCKFDGRDTSFLNSREFRQIAGRAGRKGFDDRGYVIAVEPEWKILNEELRERVKQGLEKHPRWKRPPRRNYKEWTEKTFRLLLQRQPESMKSQFQLSMGQVMTLFQGSAIHGRDGADELQLLIDRAQCSRRQRRFCSRQSKAFLEALRNAGMVLESVAGQSAVAEVPESVETEAALSPMLQKSDDQQRQQQQQQQREEGPQAASVDALLFSDNSSLYIAEVVPFLRERLGDDDYPLALVAAVEAVCEAPTAVMRAMKGSVSVATCPEPLQRLLWQGFSSFRCRHPWVQETDFKPKGLAMLMVRDRLSFAELVKELTGPSDHQDAVIVAEGGLLRYLTDVCRLLQRGVPAVLKSSAVLEAQTFLRSAICRIDSSLLLEWEQLHKLERGTTNQEVSDDGSNTTSTPQAGASKTSGGGMIPQSDAPACKRRSQAELEAHVQALNIQMQERRRLSETSQKIHAAGSRARLGRWCSRIGTSISEGSVWLRISNACSWLFDELF